MVWQRARRASAALAVCAASLVVTLRPAAAGDAEDADDPDLLSYVVETCALSAGPAARLVTRTMKPSCGNEDCSYLETYRVESDAAVLLSIENPSTGNEQERRVAVTCEGGLVRLRPLDDPTGPHVEFGYDPAKQALRLMPGALRTVERAWQRPATKNTEELARRRALENLVLTVAFTEEESELRESVRELGESVELLSARDELVAETWDSAEARLQPEPSQKLAPWLERQRVQLQAELDAARRRELPLRLVDRRALGTTLTVQTLPLDVGSTANLFWRGEEVCVVAEEPTPSTMRCFSTRLGRFSPPQPLSRPESGGHLLKAFGFPHVLRCAGAYVVQAPVPDGNSVCEGGPGEPLEELVGIVERDAILLQRDNVFLLNRGPQQNEVISIKVANALLRNSAGTFLVGDGCCRFSEDKSLHRFGENPEKSWNVLGRPPNGDAWVAMPLVSPDQRWVVAQSGYGKGPRPVTLWLFRVVRLR